MPMLPLVAVPHPVGGLPHGEVEKKADQALDDIFHALVEDRDWVLDPRQVGGEPKKGARVKGLFAAKVVDALAREIEEQIAVEDSPEEIFQLFQAKGWTDGLPFLLPIEERVAKMLAYTDRDAKEVLAVLPPRWGEATVEKIAINAVMAGCLPQDFPVVLTSVIAMADEAFNLYAIQATTHPCAPLLLVNGPMAKELEINCGYNALGQGWRSNATIGRAARLILMNIGGGLPGVLDRATLGQPGKYSYCLAENEGKNPWQPLHVEKGFHNEDSTVTVIGAEGPHNINDHGSNSARDILKTAAHTMAVPGCNNAILGGEPLLLLGPEHAATIAHDGFSKDDVKKFLFEKARVSLSNFSRANRERIRKMRPQLKRIFEKGGKIPIADEWKDLHVIVAGGAGKHSAFIPTFGATRCVTKAIAWRDGSPVRSIREFQR